MQDVHVRRTTFCKTYE